MTQLRLYPIHIGRKPDVCAGCAVPLPPGSSAVLRQDGVKFCVERCAQEHDDALVGVVTAQVAE